MLAAVELQARGQADAPLEQLVIEEWIPDLQAGGHAGAVDLHQHAAGAARS